MAPIFSFVTNLLEIQIKLNRMSSYSRRFQAQGASGIGSWSGVMELISMVSIPINVAILLFTSTGKDDNGEFPNSATMQYFLDREEGRTKFEVVLILIAIEHVLLGIKIVMAQLIPDVPNEVLVDERRRPKIQAIAEEEMHKLKREQDLKTIDEIMDEISKENQRKAAEQIEREVFEQVQRNANVDPDALATKKRKKMRMMEDIQAI